jgi:hypothetical protein
MVISTIDECGDQVFMLDPAGVAVCERIRTTSANENIGSATYEQFWIQHCARLQITDLSPPLPR